MKRPVKISIRVFFLQLAVALVILMLLSAYLWFVQLKYDDAKVGYERALLYGLVVFGAGLSYDCAKKVFFLSQSAFLTFAKHAGEAFLHLLFVASLCGLSAWLLNVGCTIPGQVAYVAALSWLFFLIDSSSKALEIAAKS